MNPKKHKWLAFIFCLSLILGSFSVMSYATTPEGQQNPDSNWGEGLFDEELNSDYITPEAIEPENITPEAIDPEADNEEPDEAGEPGNEPIDEENVSDEETSEPVVDEEANEEDLVEEPLEEAIIEDPVAATLTIVQRLIVGDKHLDDTEIIEGLIVGDIIDLTSYVRIDEWLTFTGNIEDITLNEEQNTIVLEYKPAPGVIVVLPEDMPEDEPGAIQ